MVKKLKLNCPFILFLIFICLAISGCNKTPSDLSTTSSVVPSNGQGKNEDTALPNQSDSQASSDTSASQQPNQEDEKAQDYVWSVSDSGGELPPPIWMAIYANTSKIKVGENLEATLLYHPLAGDYNKLYKYETVSSVKCTITLERFDNEDKIPNSDIIIRNATDYSIEEYEEYNHRNGTVIFSTVEKLTFPAEWFSYRRGAFVLYVAMDIYFEESPEVYREGSAIALFYIKEDDNILIFGSYYDYNNYERIS